MVRVFSLFKIFYLFPGNGIIRNYNVNFDFLRVLNEFYFAWQKLLQSQEKKKTKMLPAAVVSLFFIRLIETSNLKQSMSTLEVHIMNYVPKIIILQKERKKARQNKRMFLSALTTSHTNTYKNALAVKWKKKQKTTRTRERKQQKKMGIKWLLLRDACFCSICMFFFCFFFMILCASSS